METVLSFWKKPNPEPVSRDVIPPMAPTNTADKRMTLYKKFDKRKALPLVTYTNGVQDDPPKQDWVATLWVERGEDLYALLSYKKGETVRVIIRDEWIKAKEF